MNVSRFSILAIPPKESEKALLKFRFSEKATCLDVIYSKKIFSNFLAFSQCLNFICQAKCVKIKERKEDTVTFVPLERIELEKKKLPVQVLQQQTISDFKKCIFLT